MPHLSFSYSTASTTFVQHFFIISSNVLSQYLQLSDFHYSPSFAVVSVFQFIMYTTMNSKDPRISKFEETQERVCGKYDRRIYFLVLNHSEIETLFSLMFFFMMSTDTENRFTSP